MSKGKMRLGKGLDALLPPAPADTGTDDVIKELPLKAIQPNPHQPRRSFDDAALKELADSIQAHGLVQPILVSPSKGGYLLVAGERRWRAARLAGLKTIPAIVRRLDDLQRAAIALIENLQREDLTPLEEAEAYQALQETHGLTQAEIAQQVGKSRSQVANTLRLLQLDPEVQKLLARQVLSRGHAKVLLSVADPHRQQQLAREVLEKGLTVRELEQELRQLAVGSQRVKDRSKAGKARPSAAVDPETKAFIGQLEKALGSPVTLVNPVGHRPGRIVIEFFGDEDLDRLYELLIGAGAGGGSFEGSKRFRQDGGDD